MQGYHPLIALIIALNFSTPSLQGADKTPLDSTKSNVNAPNSPSLSSSKPEIQIKPFTPLQHIKDSMVSVSISIQIQSTKEVLAENLAITLFLIEPNGDVRESSTPHIALKEGMNTGGFNDVFMINHPIKGNYVIGYLARFKEETDVTASFSGKIKAVLKRPSRTETFVSEQIPEHKLNGLDIITVSSNIVLLDQVIAEGWKKTE